MFPDLPSHRRLTARELSQLADLERRLGAEDPQLARAFGGGSATRMPRAAVAVFLGVSLALAVAAALVGGFGGAAAVVVTLAATWAALGLPAVRRRRRAAATTGSPAV